MSSTQQYDRNNPDDAIFGDQQNNTGITPVGYKILIEIATPEYIQSAKSAGLVMAETAEERHTNAAVCAKVIQLGAGCYRQDQFPEGPWCKPGDWIIMSPYSGTRVMSPKDDKDYRFINEDSIEGIVPGPEYVDRGRA